MSPHYIFCFLEIFAHEGGIQSYIQDIFAAYSAYSKNQLPPAQILLLRDSPHPGKTDHSKLLKFDYFKTPYPWLSRLNFSLTLLKYLFLNRPTRVFCGHINLAPLVQTLCQPLGIPYTILTYGKEVWEPLTPAYKNALHKADRLLTISRYTRDRTCEIQQLNPAQFDLLPCMVNQQIFTPGAKSPTLIAKYNLTNAKVLMTVARLWPGENYKGVDVTIKALPQILQIFPNVKYLVIGRGDDRIRLTKIADDLGVRDQVIFAGFIPNHQLVEHYRLADIYVMPSQEGFGIAYLEAMACGIPVISGNADGSAEPLQDGQLGWRVPFRSVEAVAQACIEILHKSDRISSNWANGDRRCDPLWLREQTIKSFGIEAFQAKVYDLFAN